MKMGQGLRGPGRHMKNRLTLIAACILISLRIPATSAQVASHAPTAVASAASAQISPLQASDKPVVRVNGVALTDRDLLREMFAIFPYAQQHNGFPKAQEPAIRQGALQMIIFEELVYQEAQRRKLAIPDAKLNQAEAEFRQQFSSPDQYDQYLKAEMHGSEKQLRQQIRRSLLIERILKSDVEEKATVSPAEVQAYYAKNAKRFEQGEMFAFQSISVIPPLKAGADVAKDAKKRADEALRQAKATKNYQDFGLLAEKISEDDFRVNMGDHKAVSAEKLPPQIVSALRMMQPGQVSGLIQIENAYTVVRLNAHTPSRKKPFTEVKSDLTTELQKSKYEKLRSNLDKQLRARAKIENA